MVPASPNRCTKATKCRCPFAARSSIIEKSREAQSARSIRSSSPQVSSKWLKVERRQFSAGAPSLVDPYSKISLSSISVSFQRNPRPSKIGCSVSMKTSPRDRSRPPALQRSQKPRTRSFSGKPVRPWLTSQFINRSRGVKSISYYAAQSRGMKDQQITRWVQTAPCDFAGMTLAPSSFTKEATG